MIDVHLDEHHLIGLSIGKDFPNPTLLVFIFNNSDFLYDVKLLKNLGELSFSGRIIRRNGYTAMLVFNPKQINLTQKQQSIVVKPQKIQSKKEIDEMQKKLNKLLY